MVAALELVLPPIVVFTMLFGVLSRGSPRPGGVALFWRVGLVGLALAAALTYLTHHTNVLVNTPAFVTHAYLGLFIGGVALTLFAAVGTWLKKKER